MVVGIAGGSALLVKVLRRRYPELFRESENRAVEFIVVGLLTAWALYVSFLISALLDQASARDSEARAEATASIQLARDSFALPGAEGDQLRRSLLSYEQSAIAEWPLASQGQSLPQAEKALTDLHETFLIVGRRITGQALFPMSEIEPNLDSLSQARSSRILEGAINNGLTESLWTILLLTSGLVVASGVLVGSSNLVLHYGMVCVIGALVAGFLYLVIALDGRCLAESCYGDITAPQPPVTLQYVVDFLTKPTP
jgi:hypothetical protein